MKKLSIIIFFSLTLGNLYSQTEATKKTPDIYFTQETFDFGQIEPNKLAQHDFIFYNSGTAPLLLKDVKPSCGCTVPTWPKNPIKPGDSAKISVSFNPKDDAGKVFNKTIKITTNIKEADHDKVVVIYIKGKVLPADQQNN